MDNTDLPAPPDTSKMRDTRVVVPVLGLGRFAPFARDWSADKPVLRPYWGRIMIWLLSIVIIGWTSLATGAYAFVKYRRGFTEVRYSHILLLPWKLDDYRRAKGEFTIKQGLDLAEKQEWRAAFNLLRTGLLTVPEHREARLMVARLYLMAGRPDVVRTTLLDGLPHHGDQLDYLRQVLGFFFGLQADDTVITLTKELRGRLDPAAPAYRMATTALAYAYFNRNRYAEADALLRDSRLLGTPEGRFVTARIHWDRGRRGEALTQLRELTSAVPEDNEIYRTYIFYLKEEKRWSEVRRASLSRQFALPDRPDAYVDFIAACGEENDEARRVEAETAFFERFATDVPALIKLAEEAARVGRAETAGRVLAKCRALGTSEPDATLLLALAHLERRGYNEVLALIEHISPGTSKWSERQRLVLGGVQASALYAVGRDAEAEPFIRQICESRLLPPHLLTTLADHLKTVGKEPESLRLLRHAVEIDPLNQPALVRLLRKAQEENNLRDSLVLIERLLGMRKPPVELLTALEADLSSDRYLFLPGRERTEAAIKAWLAAREK
jgi:tetratricopeptide (TPR) repeat protein